MSTRVGNLSQSARAYDTTTDSPSPYYSQTAQPKASLCEGTFDEAIRSPSLNIEGVSFRAKAHKREWADKLTKHSAGTFCRRPVLLEREGELQQSWLEY
jgi:hypothetical protein